MLFRENDLTKKVQKLLWCTLWKNEKFTLTEIFFRQINSLVIYLVNALLSRNFCQKSVRVNSNNFHTVARGPINLILWNFRQIKVGFHTVPKDALFSLCSLSKAGLTSLELKPLGPCLFSYSKRLTSALFWHLKFVSRKNHCLQK